jgi:hypothetical protein
LRGNSKEKTNGTGERYEESPPQDVEPLQEQVKEWHGEYQDQGIQLAEDVEFAEFQFAQGIRCAVPFVRQAVIVR